MNKIILGLCFVLMALMTIASVSACDTNNFTTDENNLEEGNDISIPFVHHTTPDTGGSIYADGSNVDNCSDVIVKPTNEVKYSILPQKLEYSVNPIIIHENYTVERDIYCINFTVLKPAMIENFTLNLDIYGGIVDEHNSYDFSNIFINGYTIYDKNCSENSILLGVSVGGDFTNVTGRITYLNTGETFYQISEFAFEKADFKLVQE